MSNFKATNSFKLTRFAFYERLRYKLLAYENINHSNLKNISFSSLNLYGKINNNYDAEKTVLSIDCGFLFIFFFILFFSLPSPE